MDIPQNHSLDRTENTEIAVERDTSHVPFRWWLLALIAAIMGGLSGVYLAHFNRPSSLASSGVFTPTVGTFTRVAPVTAPSFRLVSLEHSDQVVSLNQFRGRPLVVNFWASWCPPCRKEMPALADVARQLQGKVDFVGLDTEDERNSGLSFSRATGVRFSLAIDTAQVASSYGVYGLPTTVFISAGGKVLGKEVGGLTKARLFDAIRQIFGAATRLH